MKYRKIDGKTGVKYWKDGKFVKKSDVPSDVYQQLENNPEYEVRADKPCLFCGEPGTKQRYINMLMIDLCDEHYFNTNIGQTAQKLREGEDYGSDTQVLEGQ